MTPVRTRRRVVVALAAFGMVTLASCTPIKAGSAAIVGDQSLSENTLATVATEIVDFARAKGVDIPEQSALNQRVVSLWVGNTLTFALADDLKVRASQANVDDLLGQLSPDQLTQVTVSSGIAPSQLQDAARAAVLRGKIASAVAPSATSQNELQAALAKAYLAEAQKLHVSVNPRYGVWNVTTAQVEGRTDLLSQLADPSSAPGSTPPTGG
ncbi:MAG: hypothetical protein WAN48_02120 [Actinomycetes bacterium]